MKFFQCVIFIGFAIALNATAHANHTSIEEVRVAATAVELRATDDMVIAGGVGPSYAKGQDGLLRAVATVIQGPPSGKRVVIVALDILMIRRDHLDSAAMEIERRTGIPFDHIVINCTHTHYAPAAMNLHGHGDAPNFAAQVKNAIIEAAVAADKKLSASPPMRTFFIMGREGTVGQNSRIEMRYGMISWANFAKDEQLRPTGPFDPDFPVMVFTRPDESLAAVIFGHSTHSVGTRNSGRRSPAFYGLAAQEFERETGAVTTFIEGASGSTHPLQMAASNSFDPERRILNALRYHVDQASELTVYRIGSLKREVIVQVRNFNEDKEEHAISAYCEKVHCDEKLGLDKGETAAIFRQERADLNAHRGEKRKTWLSATRIGDVAIVGVPAELFAQLGLEIKARSPFRYTIIAELANDHVGYVGNADAYRLGGYQLWMGHHSWTERGTGELFVNEAVELLHELYVQ